MTVLFWGLVAAVMYVYAGYPLLLLAIRSVNGARRPALDAREPVVTLIISAFNEQDVIAEKLDNCLEIDYPRDRLEILVVSDASDDRTDEIVSGYHDRGVSLLRMAERGGKTVGLNAAVSRARGDIVVFSDANALYYRQALRMLVRNFACAEVGAVVGESTYVTPELESERSEGLYWRYEVAIKRLESDVDSVVGGDGAIYAIRRALYVPMRPDAISDFVNPLQIVKDGHRCIYESGARSYERAASDFQKEFRRKVRIVNRAWRATFRMTELLNPFRHGFFAVELVSHKLLRWLVPFFLAGSLLSNLWLLRSGPVYAVTMAAQALLYGLALCGFVLRDRPRMPSVVSVPFFFASSTSRACSASGMHSAVERIRRGPRRAPTDSDVGGRITARFVRGPADGGPRLH